MWWPNWERRVASVRAAGPAPTTRTVRGMVSRWAGRSLRWLLESSKPLEQVDADDHYTHNPVSGVTLYLHGYNTVSQ